MKKLSLCLILLLLIVTANDAQSRKALAQVQLLEVGGFHGNEVKARTSSGWLGLYVTKKKSALISSRIKVHWVEDPIADVGTKRKTGKAVEVGRKPDPVFLLKGASMLKPGPAVTVFWGEKFLGNGESIPLTLAGENYRVEIASKFPSHEGTVAGDAKFTLVKGKEKQILYALKNNHEAVNDFGWSLLWAGDIDGDHKLDLYVNVTDHYNLSIKKLFLSSQAGKGQLVWEVARFETTGC